MSSEAKPQNKAGTKSPAVSGNDPEHPDHEDPITEKSDQVPDGHEPDKRTFDL